MPMLMMLQPKRQKAAVLKQQTLHHQNCRHGDDAGRRTQKDCKQHPATEVAACAGHTGQSEVDHLGREYERTHNAHQRQSIIARGLSGDEQRWLPLELR